MAPWLSIFGDFTKDPDAMYNNFRVYGTCLLMVMGEGWYNFHYDFYSYKNLFIIKPTFSNRSNVILFIFTIKLKLFLSLNTILMTIYRLHCLRWSKVCQQICHSCTTLCDLLNYCCLYWSFYELWRKRSFEVSFILNFIFNAVNSSRRHTGLLLFYPILSIFININFVSLSKACAFLENVYSRISKSITAPRRLMAPCGKNFVSCKTTQTIVTL